MKRILAAGAVLTIALGGLGLSACSPAESAEEVAIASDQEGPSGSMDSRFVGTWELVSFESFPESGEAVDNNYIGRIIYDEHGNMTGVGMPRDFPERAAAAPSGEVRSSGFAYWSNAELFPEENRIVHHVIGSPMNPVWPGTDLVRYYEFTDDGLLTLSIRNDTGRVTGTLTWRKLQAPGTDQL
ncbi:MAG: lipocalin-like domain-containing protein [Gemmatimonadota bacterium]